MDLLAPDVSRIAPEASEAAKDRVPDELASGTPEPLRGELIDLLGSDRVLTRIIDLVRYASDASPYRLLPQAVVMARDANDVSKVLSFGRRNGVPVTFRAGGTSLNGQAQSDGILVDVRRHWSGVEVLDDGARARVKPGTVLGHANRVLAPHGRKLGPDPASTDIACVGGVVANNSGGMRCGVVADSYSTVRSLTFVLPSGTVIDTAAPDAAEMFERAEPDLAKGLTKIRDEIRADAELSERIRKKFRIKNTTGYRLCAFLDADEPVEIFRRLLIGSEGTLGFIAEAVFETVPLPARTTVSWLHFDGIESATEPVPALVEAGATAVELMVAPALMVASQNIAGAPQDWMELPPTSAALLVEFGAETDGELDRLVAGAEEILREHEMIRPADFTRDPERVEVSWTVREGLHGLIGRFRAPGTSLIIEDVCVSPERIAESARDIQGLLTEHGFLPGVAGHASAGNLHFMLTPDFSKQEDVERYETFMEKLVDLILDKYDGSLKAEHGTGINMSPYVEREWGEMATELMWRAKALADPEGVLAPGVVLNRDERRPSPQPEDDTRDRGGRHHLRRVRLLRAGLPEPPPDHHAAAANRDPAGDGAAAGGVPGAAGPARAVRVRRPPDLRRRRDLPDRLPARHRHRRADQGVPRRAAHRSAPSGRRPAWPGAGPSVEHTARAGLRAGAVAGPLMRAGAAAARSAVQRRDGSVLASQHAVPRRRRSCPGARARAPPPSTCPPASTGSSARQHQTGRAWRRALALTGPGSLCRRRWWRSRREPGCRSGSRTTSPATAARSRGRRRATPRVQP